MLEYLKEIKEGLFDAPSEVKEAFNSIVRYFDDIKTFIVVSLANNPYLLGDGNFINVDTVKATSESEAINISKHHKYNKEVRFKNSKAFSDKQKADEYIGELKKRYKYYVDKKTL